MFKKLLGGGMGEEGIVGVLFTFWQCPKAAMTFQGERESGAHRAAPAPFLSLGFLCIYFLRSFLRFGAVDFVHGPMAS